MVPNGNGVGVGGARAGGVGIRLGHGSILLEAAKKELHSTTALKNPDLRDPKRISVVFYQHKKLNFLDHGLGTPESELAKKPSAQPSYPKLPPPLKSNTLPPGWEAKKNTLTSPCSDTIYTKAVNTKFVVCKSENVPITAILSDSKNI